MTLPVSLSRSIAAERSLTHPRNADGDGTLKELLDDNLPLLLPFPLTDSRVEAEDELGLFEVGPEFELLLDELLLSRNINPRYIVRIFWVNNK